MSDHVVTEEEQACMSNRCIHKKPWLYNEDGTLKTEETPNE